MTHVQPTSEIEWLNILADVAIYELSHDDKLTHAAHRLCRKHPVLGPLVIFWLAGHLAQKLPWQIDPLNGKNPIYKTISGIVGRFKRWLI